MLSFVSGKFADHGLKSPLLCADLDVARLFVDSVAAPLRRVAAEHQSLLAARYLIGDISEVPRGDLARFAGAAGATGAVVRPDRWTETPSLSDVLFGHVPHVLDIYRPRGVIPISLEIGGQERPLRYIILGPNAGGAPDAVFDFDGRVLYGQEKIADSLPAGWNIGNRPLADLDYGGGTRW